MTGFSGCFPGGGNTSRDENISPNLKEQEPIYAANFGRSNEWVVVGRGENGIDVSVPLANFEHKGILGVQKYENGKPIRARTKEEVADEARRRHANFVIDSSNGNYGCPYIFLKLNDDNFLRRIQSIASVFG